MNIAQYLCRKYGTNWATTLNRSEARILGVPYPLKSGWMREYGHKEITKEQRSRLIASLEARLKNGKGTEALNRNGLDLLRCGAVAVDAPPERRKKSYRKPADLTAAFESTDAFLASYEWRKLRMQAIKRYGTRCQCCGATPEHGVRIHVDHIKPRRLFPDLALTIDNLQILCEACNHGKGNWDMTDWRTEDVYT